MNCPNCGKQIPDTAKVCGYCGTKLVATQIPPARRPEPMQAPAPTGGTYKGTKKVPAWVWGLVGVLGVLLVGAMVSWLLGVIPGVDSPLPTRSPQVIPLSNPCGERVAAQAGRPLLLQYGYWGVLDDYFESNFKSIDFRISIDGKRYVGKRSERTLSPAEVPCLDLERNDLTEAWRENSQWFYDELELDALPAGTHQVEVSYYADASLYDGSVDESGALIEWGPGELGTFSFELTLEP